MQSSPMTTTGEGAFTVRASELSGLTLLFSGQVTQLRLFEFADVLQPEYLLHRNDLRLHRVQGTLFVNPTRGRLHGGD